MVQVEGDGERVGESLGSRSASGVRPARAPAVAAGGEVAGLPRVCLPAAGRCLKARVLGCCGAGRSLVAWVWRVLRWLVCLSALLPPAGALSYKCMGFLVDCCRPLRTPLAFPSRQLSSDHLVGPQRRAHTHCLVGRSALGAYFAASCSRGAISPNMAAGTPS